MDPVSLIAGLVSLAIPIAKDVSNYIDGVKGSKKELEKLATLTQTLDLILKSLEVYKIRIQTLPMDDRSQILQILQASVAQINGELATLKALIQKLRVPEGSTSSFESFARETRRQLAHPFNRHDLLQLEQRLTSLLTLVSTAMHLADSCVTTLHVTKQPALLEAQVNRQELFIEASLNRHSARLVQRFDDNRLQFQQHTREVEEKLEGLFSRFETQFLNPLQGCQTTLKEFANAHLMKPAALADAADQLMIAPQEVSTMIENPSLYDKSLANPHSLRRVCTCRQERSFTRHQLSLGPVAIDIEAKPQAPHDPSCPMSLLLVTESTKAVKLSLRLSNYRQNVATVIAFGLRYSYQGLRQWSLAPEIQAFNMVSMWKCPVQKIGCIITEWTWRSAERSSAVEYSEIADYIRQSLEHLFALHQASPRDIYFENGQNLLHNMNRRDSPIVMAEAIASLFGVDRDCKDTTSTGGYMSLVNMQDNAGRTPVETYVSCEDNGKQRMYRHRFIQRSSWLVPDQTGRSHIQALVKDWIEWDVQSLQSWCESIRNRAELLQLYNIGDLCQSIVFKSIGLMKQTLQQDSTWMDEEFSHIPGVNPLVLCLLTFPEGAKFLSRSPWWESIISANWLEISCVHLHRGILELALCSLHNYSYDLNAMLQLEQVIIRILEARIPIFWDQTCRPLLHGWQHGKLGMLLSPAATKVALRVQRLVVLALADRRRKYAIFAQQHLQDNDAIRLHLDSCSLPDLKAGEIMVLLQNSGHEIPPDLVPYQNPPREAENRSVFDITGYNPRLAEELLDAGFTLLDSSQCIVMDLHTVRYQSVEFFEWLVRYLGYNSVVTPQKLRMPLTPCSKYTGPPFLSSQNLGDLWECPIFAVARLLSRPYIKEDGQQISSEFFRILSSAQDSCSCGCSDHGCRALAVMATRYKSGNFWSPGNKDLLQEMFRGFNTYAAHGAFTKDIGLYILRAFAFEALECRHTCCRMLPTCCRPCQWSATQDEEEKEEIRSEDAEKLEILELLVNQLQEDYSNSTLDFHGFLQQRWELHLSHAREQLRSRQTQNLDTVFQQLGISRLPSDNSYFLPPVPEGDYSYVSEDNSSDDEAQKADRARRRTLAVKRAIDRVTGWSRAENGPRTYRKSPIYMKAVAEGAKVVHSFDER